MMRGGPKKTMKLLEYQAKNLLRSHGVAIPRGRRVQKHVRVSPVGLPCVLKAQVVAMERMKKGGIVVARTPQEFAQAAQRLFCSPIDGVVPESVLVESYVPHGRELYVSISFDTDQRLPVVAVSARGGSGVSRAELSAINPDWGLQDFQIRALAHGAGVAPDRAWRDLLRNLWRLFSERRALTVEVNPLLCMGDGTYLAVDAKITLDDHVVRPRFRPYLELEGDIAVLASGGGASLVNLDALLRHGGKPANYVEYSGNPPARVVAALTRRVLKKPGLRGCWVIGGTANFTDVAETLRGFVLGLRRVRPKPRYPFVIRRDGPGREKAFASLRRAAASEGYQFHLFGPETPMAASAALMVKLAYRGHIIT